MKEEREYTEEDAMRLNSVFFGTSWEVGKADNAKFSSGEYYNIYHNCSNHEDLHHRLGRSQMARQKDRPNQEEWHCPMCCTDVPPDVLAYYRLITMDGDS